MTSIYLLPVCWFFLVVLFLCFSSNSSSFLPSSKDGSYAVTSKGAAEQTLKLCNRMVTSLGADINGVPITPEMQKKLETHLNDMASRGLRTLALAYKRLKPEEGRSLADKPEDAENVWMIYSLCNEYF